MIMNLPLGATGGGNLRKQRFGVCEGFLRTAYLAWRAIVSPVEGGKFFCLFFGKVFTTTGGF